jgi:hypothetical protein
MILDTKDTQRGSFCTAIIKYDSQIESFNLIDIFNCLVIRKIGIRIFCVEYIILSPECSDGLLYY